MAAIDPSSIPRYAQPMDPPERPHRCVACRHCIGVEHDDNGLHELWWVCVAERDDGSMGDAYEVEPADTDEYVGCDRWEAR